MFSNGLDEVAEATKSSLSPTAVRNVEHEALASSKSLASALGGMSPCFHSLFTSSGN